MHDGHALLRNLVYWSIIHHTSKVKWFELHTVTFTTHSKLLHSHSIFYRREEGEWTQIVVVIQRLSRISCDLIQLHVWCIARNSRRSPVNLRNIETLILSLTSIDVYLTLSFKRFHVFPHLRYHRFSILKCSNPSPSLAHLTPTRRHSRSTISPPKCWNLERLSWRLDMKMCRRRRSSSRHPFFLLFNPIPLKCFSYDLNYIPRVYSLSLHLISN